MRGYTLARILRNIATAVENMDESQLETFASNLKQMTSGSGRMDENKNLMRNRHSKVDPIELENVLQNLIGLHSRQEGAQLLDQLELSRKELETLARLRNIHVTKDDNISKIKEKLVEVIIGARLSSRAIRGQ